MVKRSPSQCWPTVVFGSTRRYKEKNALKKHGPDAVHVADANILEMNYGPTSDEINDALRTVIKHPLLENVRALEKKLATRFGKRVFGRINQKASIEAASESDRGVTERLANAFDASLTAGRLAVGIEKSDRTLTPRNAAQRFFCLAPEQCEWTPQDERIQKIARPIIEFWPEAPESRHRFRKHNPTDGLVLL
jgi:hypothetical protein